MTVLKTSDIDAKERGGGRFKGRVTAQSVLDSDIIDLRTNLINFDEGAVNVFHTHDFDQVALRRPRPGPCRAIWSPGSMRPWSTREPPEPLTPPQEGARLARYKENLP